MCQMSRQYSRTERSDENHPMRATFRIDERVQRSGSLPFVRWRRAGIWDHIMETLAANHNPAVQMIDTSVVRVHQHGAETVRARCSIFKDKPSLQRIWSSDYAEACTAERQFLT